jgi:hypothetical protein
MMELRGVKRWMGMKGRRERDEKAMRRNTGLMFVSGFVLYV